MVDSVVMLKWPTFAFSAVSPLIGRPSIVNQNDLGSLIPTISDIFLFSILMLSLGRTSRTTVAPVRVCSSSCKCRYEASLRFRGGALVGNMVKPCDHSYKSAGDSVYDVGPASGRCYLS